MKKSNNDIFSKPVNKEKTKCLICPHECELNIEQIGRCKARFNNNGNIESKNYGIITSYALDPIRKKPLYHFEQGKNILSIGSCGCNFNCPFCQNYTISMSDYMPDNSISITPQNIVEHAKQLNINGGNNIGIAYTYNEPTINYEYVYDCSVLIKEAGLKNVLVTNGYINKKPLLKLLPFIDAMNIDLKCFTDRFYKMVGGSLKEVLETIETSVKHCHVEITSLIIPEENDNPNDMENMCIWISNISEDIPLHLSRFFPAYKYYNKEATSIDKLYELKYIADKYLKYVYLGNVNI